MLKWFITGIAVGSLFIVTTHAAAAMFIWIITNSFWCISNYRRKSYEESLMFAAFLLAAAIQFWRLSQ